MSLYCGKCGYIVDGCECKDGPSNVRGGSYPTTKDQFMKTDKELLTALLVHLKFYVSVWKERNTPQHRYCATGVEKLIKWVEDEQVSQITEAPEVLQAAEKLEEAPSLPGTAAVGFAAFTPESMREETNAEIAARITEQHEGRTLTNVTMDPVAGMSPPSGSQFRVWNEIRDLRDELTRLKESLRQDQTPMLDYQERFTAWVSEIHKLKEEIELWRAEYKAMLMFMRNQQQWNEQMDKDWSELRDKILGPRGSVKGMEVKQYFLSPRTEPLTEEEVRKMVASGTSLQEISAIGMKIDEARELMKGVKDGSDANKASDDPGLGTDESFGQDKNLRGQE